MAAHTYQDLASHVGHTTEVVTYADRNAAVECLDCGEVLLDIDREGCTPGCHRPDDDPEPGDRCKDYGQTLTWVGPGPYDRTTDTEQEDES